MASVVKAPEKYSLDKFSLFLGGVIDQGKAQDWQAHVAEVLSGYDVLLLNPRRDDWDDTWKQEKDDPQFREQVTWELEAQSQADICLYVFGADEEEAKKAKAPVTFLEFGLFRDKAMVCCPQGFYRKGNVDIVAEKFDVPLYGNLEALLLDLKTLLDQELRNA